MHYIDDLLPHAPLQLYAAISKISYRDQGQDILNYIFEAAYHEKEKRGSQNRQVRYSHKFFFNGRFVHEKIVQLLLKTGLNQHHK